MAEPGAPFGRRLLLAPARAARQAVRSAFAWDDVRRWRGAAAPMLVHTMPKSGSTSVETALAEAGRAVLKTHFLGAGHERARALNRRAGAALPLHMHLERRLRPLIGEEGGARLKVVTLVRDPVARDLSTIFQSPWLFGLDPSDANGASRLVARRVEEGAFCETWLRWFDEELTAVFGADPAAPDAAPFDRERGVGLFSGRHADLLVLRTERLDGLAAPLSDFVGRPVAPGRENARSGRKGSEAYAALRDGLTAPRAALEAIYGSPWARRFYTEEERDGFIRRWSGG